MALYVPGMASTAQAALFAAGSRALVLKFTADRMTAGKLSRLFLQSIAINANPQVQRASADSLAVFFNAFKGSLRPGDVLTLSEKTNASGVRVYLNGQTLANIEDPQFFNLLLLAWVGAVPPSTEFKAALLGQYEPEDLARFEQIAPSAEREAAIAAWVAPDTQKEIANTADTEVASASQSASVTVAEPEPEPQAPAAELVDSAPASVAAAEPEQAAPVAEQRSSQAPSPELVAPEPLAAEPKSLAPAPAVVAARVEEEEDLPDFSAASLEVLQDYTALLVKLTHEHIHYPRRAMKLRQTGSVRMAVVIDAAGELLEMRPLLESEHKQLNDAVERAVEDAAPYPPLPAALSAEHFEFVFPITFMLES